ATPTNDGLIVAADGVEIKSVAIVGMTNGIEVVAEAEEFFLKDSWVGVLLNGEPGGNTTGVRLGPGSQGSIGGPNEGQRNDTCNNGPGVDREGTHFVAITGNYFGVGPGGGVEPESEADAANFKDIEVTDYSGVAAEHSFIGGSAGAEFAEAPC